MVSPVTHWTAAVLIGCTIAFVVTLRYLVRAVNKLTATLNRYLQILTAEMPEPNPLPELPVSARVPDAFVGHMETDRVRAASSGYEFENS